MTLLKFDHCTSTQILREIQFWQIQTVQKCLFGNFRDSKFGFFSKLEQLSSIKFTKIQSSEFLKLWKLQVFRFKFCQNYFLLKIEGQMNSCIVDLNFIFWKFLEHSVLVIVMFVWNVKIFEWQLSLFIVILSEKLANFSMVSREINEITWIGCEQEFET